MDSFEEHPLEIFEQFATPLGLTYITCSNIPECVTPGTQTRSTESNLNPTKSMLSDSLSYVAVKNNILFNHKTSSRYKSKEKRIKAKK
jgi:hypothetical protein